jgi:hypothetical protein
MNAKTVPVDRPCLNRYLSLGDVHNSLLSLIYNYTLYLPVLTISEMALNPPIESLPIQETDRDGHLQRYLSGLPDFGSWQDQDQGEGKLDGLVRTR